MVFGRRKGRDEDVVDEDSAAAASPDSADDSGSGSDSGSGDAVDVAVVAATTGPWDAADAPADEVQRIDLGGLQVPVPEDGELRVDVDPDSQLAQAVLVVVGESVLQLGAFAAPKTQGIWAEV